MRTILLVGFAFVSLAGSLVSEAQAVSRGVSPTSKAKQPAGTVTGTVYCADTNLPARLATVHLDPAPKEASQPYMVGGRTGSTDLEGRFSISHVPEGKYFATVDLSGYQSSHSELIRARLLKDSPEERKQLESRLVAVTVAANQTTEVALRLERGAEIDGTVLYDDGSPAIGLRVNLQSKSAPTGKTEPVPFPIAEPINGAPEMTDDHGRFRLAGMPPGEYLLNVVVPTATSASAADDVLMQLLNSSVGALFVYYGDTLRVSKAKVIKVEAGERSLGADLTVPLGSLHTIQGTVTLKSTGQAPPAATVQLLYADTREVARTALARDGAFEITYAPEGNFILSAIASSTPMPRIRPDGEEDNADGVGAVAGSGWSFSMSGEPVAGGAEVPLVIKGDVEGVNIAVPDPPANVPQKEPEARPVAVVPN